MCVFVKPPREAAQEPPITRLGVREGGERQGQSRKFFSSLSSSCLFLSPIPSFYLGLLVPPSPSFSIVIKEKFVLFLSRRKGRERTKGRRRERRRRKRRGARGHQLHHPTASSILLCAPIRLAACLHVQNAVDESRLLPPPPNLSPSGSFSTLRLRCTNQFHPQSLHCPSLSLSLPAYSFYPLVLRSFYSNWIFSTASMLAWKSH